MVERRRKSDGSGLSPRAASIVASFSPLLAALAAEVPARTLMPRPGVGSDVLRALRDRAGGAVSGIVSADEHFRTSRLSRAVKDMLVAMSRGNAFFDPATRRIVYSRSVFNPGVLAHETGHALNYAALGRALTALRGASGIGATAGLLATAMAGDEDSGGRRALMGSLAGLPLLGEETLASVRGLAALPKRVPLRGRLAAMLGLPTYAALAAGPELLHQTRKYLGGYDKSASAGMVKDGWIFSMPMGGAFLPSDAMSVPKYTLQAVRGPNREDTTPRLRSLGLAGLGAMFGLMNLGMLGMGVRGLGSKLGVLGSRGLGRKVPAALKDVARTMDVPAYRRHYESIGWPGYVTGGIAHPFNRLEDAVTKGLARAVGPGRASGLARRLMSAGTRLETFPGVGLAMSPLMIVPTVVGGTVLQPDPSPMDVMRMRYQQMYGAPDGYEKI